MKKLIRIGILLLIVGILISTNDGLKNLFNPPTVRAFGDLTVDFHVPASTPIFTVTNMKPGDSESRPVDVTNGGAVPRMVAVRGIRTGGIGANPKLETALTIVIKDGATPVYGSGSATGNKTVADFFVDSGSTNGIQLGVLNNGDHKTYTFIVSLPQTAGNEFQAKSVIFDLSFGEITSDTLVINEVYYQVDPSKGLDSPKDRGILGVNGNNVTITIAGNGKNSKNTVTVNQKTACTILQTNNTTIVNGISSTASSGGNKGNGNTGNGTTTVTSGNATSIVNITNGGSTNTAAGCGNMLGQDDEWVEVFNPTDHDISLKDWTITDNSGATIIHPNKIVKAGSFALLVKSASTFTKWTVPASTLIVELGSSIGDGLDNAGDHLILKDNHGVEVDRMSWGTDTSGFTPPAVNPIVPLGDSTARIVPGFDTNMVSDWIDSHPPTPGS